MDVVDFPGIEARGATTTAAPARRIPTVYSPFTAGFRATLVEPMDAETTVFNLSNMTFLVANSTYEGLGESGLLNFFGLQDGQENDLLCVQNRCRLLSWLPLSPSPPPWPFSSLKLLPFFPFTFLCIRVHACCL